MQILANNKQVPYFYLDFFAKICYTLIISKNIYLKNKKQKQKHGTSPRN